MKSRKVWSRLNRYVYGVFVLYDAINDPRGTPLRRFLSLQPTLANARGAKRLYLADGCVQRSMRPAKAVLIVRYEQSRRRRGHVG